VSALKKAAIGRGGTAYYGRSWSVGELDQRHLHEKLNEERGIRLSYTWV
jgi:hypothetical protein